jgi:hypothetical protein
VVDAVDLRLVEDAHDRVVQRARRVEVVAERLLDDDPDPAVALALEAHAAEVGHDVGIGRWRRGEVEEPVSARATGRVDLFQPLLQALEIGRVTELALLVVDGFGEVLPQRPFHPAA